MFALTFAGMTFAAWIGLLIGRSPRNDAETREQFGIVRTATLTLLALVIGFSFSMALIRYDQRKDDEAAEARAIETQYLRTDLLPPADAARVRSLLLAYLDQRIAFYSSADDARLQQTRTETARLRSELWSVIRAPANVQPTPVVALVVAGMNDVLNADARTRAAWLNRIPIGAWALVLVVALLSNALLGLSARFVRSEVLVLLVLPVVVSIALFLIADIDSPRSGSIHVTPQNLISLSGALRAR